jgi:division/cell wall cluster transcriptional repressor MraZ
MSESEAKPPTQYYSRYSQRVDEKRRVQIPAKWRSEEEIKLTMVVWHQHKAGACIRVLPPQGLASALAKIDAMPASEKKVLLKRFIGGESDQVTWDKAGRIVLPDHMAKAAGIDKDAMLTGVINCFEILNPERYENVKAVDVSVANDAFTLLEE